jgi:hypothetical protein
MKNPDHTSDADAANEQEDKRFCLIMLGIATILIISIIISGVIS